MSLYYTSPIISNVYPTTSSSTTSTTSTTTSTSTSSTNTNTTSSNPQPALYKCYEINKDLASGFYRWCYWSENGKKIAESAGLSKEDACRYDIKLVKDSDNLTVATGVTSLTRGNCYVIYPSFYDQRFYSWRYTDSYNRLIAQSVQYYTSVDACYNDIYQLKKSDFADIRLR